MPVIKTKKTKTVLKTVLILTLLTVFSSCSKKVEEEQMVTRINETTLKLNDDAIKNIKLDKVVQGEFPDTIQLMGRVSIPEDRITVVPARVGGRTEAVYVASGETVSAGQPLASLFSPDFVVGREEYVQAYRQAKANPEDPEAKKILMLSRKKLDALGLAQVDIDKLNGDESTSLKSESLLVRAPRAGAIIDKKAVIGNILNPGDTLFTIGDLAKVWFAGDIYPEDLSKVHKNQQVVIVSQDGGQRNVGKVSFISPVIDPTSRTIKIRALMENPGNTLKADMYVQGNLVLSTREALICPKNALVRLNDQLFVFKQLPGGQFQKVLVETGGEQGTNVAITKGLANGDSVVTEGALLLDAALSQAGS